VSAGYFAAIGLPLLRGRLLTPDDHSRPVAVISDRTARTLWPGQDALGRSFRRGRGDVFEVVGIVADAKIQGFERDPGLVGYVPYGLNTRSGLSLVIRGDAGDAAAIASARRAIKALDPDLPLRRVRTLDSVVDDALAMRRFQVRLLMCSARQDCSLRASASTVCCRRWSRADERNWRSGWRLARRPHASAGSSSGRD
jgi:hypothetical protein